LLDVAARDSAGPEAIVSESRLPKFHIDEQYAVALLGPIGNTLVELTARLTQYVSRMPLSDADRDAIARAREAVDLAAGTVHTLAAERGDASDRKR
jgi:hypothetical protein